MDKRIASVKEERDFIEGYDVTKYERPSITSDISLFQLGKKEEVSCLNLLLIKRKNHPYKDAWAIPGGFCGMSETLDEAAYRELYEETGIQNVYLEQLYTFSNVNRDPRTRVISTAYLGIIASDIKLVGQANDDAIECQWFSVSKKDKGNATVLSFVSEDKKTHFTYEIKDQLFKLVSEDAIGLAFDHIEIISMALTRMAGKVEYTLLAYQFLPKEFTLNDLQSVFQVILGKKLHTPNFRRKVSIQLDETGKSVTTGRYSSNLYTLKKEGVYE